jgi:hypothetical protein
MNPNLIYYKTSLVGFNSSKHYGIGTDNFYNLWLKSLQKKQFKSDGWKYEYLYKWALENTDKVKSFIDKEFPKINT